MCVCSCDHGAKYSKDWHHAHFSDRSGKTQLSWLQNSCLMFTDLWLLSTKSVSTVSKMRQKIVKYSWNIWHQDMTNSKILRQKKTFYGNVLDGESKNDRPDHAERHLQISVNNFWRWRSAWSGRSFRASSSEIVDGNLKKANDIIRCKARLVKT